MPTLTTLTVNDRETTPVAHVFTPVNRDKPNSVRLRKAGLVPEGDEYISLTLEKMRDGSYKGNYKLEYPTVVTETINGVSRSRKERQEMVNVEMRFAATSTAQERKNLIGMFVNSFAASGTGVVTDAFVNLEGWT